LSDLAPGATIATGSVRRRAQLAARRPDLHFVEVRGNIARRIAQVPDGGAVVVAAAALERLGLLAGAAEILPVEVMLPQVGQGAIALTCRADDAPTRAALKAIDVAEVHAALRAERAFLAHLGGGCSAPLGAYAYLDPSGALHLEGLIADPSGSPLVRGSDVGVDPEVLGAALAADLMHRGMVAGVPGLSS
jgi:hydroxymethylbilane synthase